MRRRVEAREIYTWNDWKPGTVMDGVYQGKREVETVNGPKVQFDFRLTDGRLVTVWGSAVLFGIMPQIQVGTRVWLTYVGDEPPRRSGMLPKRLFSAEIEDPDDEPHVGAEDQEVFVGKTEEVARG